VKEKKGMTLHPQAIGSVPEETARVARAAFPKGTLYLQIRDELGTIYEDSHFADLFPKVGQPAEAPWCLALVCIIQFLEGLSDRQAAEAVRSRIDLKYLLGLELTDPGFNFSVLSEFRARLLAHEAGDRVLDRLVEHFKVHGWLKERGRQRTDSTHVLAAIRLLNRLECIGETMRAALNSLATVAPDWLRAWAEPEWFDCYSVRVEEHRLPKGEAERKRYAELIGADGSLLLTRVYDETAPSWLREVPAVQILRRTWVHQFYVEEGHVRLRAKDDLPPASIRQDSPYDPEAHYGNKRTTTWTGYKVHVTETCDEHQLHLITHVETTAAPVPDTEMTAPIHEALANKHVLPSDHLVDSGYVDADLLVNSQLDHGVRLVGPVRADIHWQVREGKGYDLSCFTIDWEHQTVTCPQGCRSSKWADACDRNGRHTIQVRFRHSDCTPCPNRSLCTKAKKDPRELTLRPREEHLALQAARHWQQTDTFKQEYRKRAGIEGTISQATRAFELRKSRYIGLARTHLQHLLTAVAINLVRFDAWRNEVPHAKTRTSRFAGLAVVNAR
jgi:transposase